MAADSQIKLTKQQQAAVIHQGGPLMIVAGAGTGKTTVLTQRVAWLIEQGIQPEQIVALTFTEKAAAELETRLDQLLPYGQVGVTSKTFHGFGQLVLERFSHLSGVYTDTVILTDTETDVLVRDHIMQFPLKTLRPLSNPTTHIRAMVQFFSRCKDELISPDQLLTYVQSERLDTTHHDRDQYMELARGYAFYQDLLRRNNVLDYGDLLFLTQQLLQDNVQVRSELQKQFTHILIDEYQDTNVAQTEIVRLLAGPDRNITVVGDDDQSIYRFRGASVGQMERFRQQFKPTIITLTENFRSSQQILDAAYALIQHNNPHRLEASAGINKRLTADNRQQTIDNRESVTVQVFPNDQQEAAWVVEDIKQRLVNKAAPSDHCILVRTNRQSYIFARELELQGLSYTTESRSLLGQDPTVKLLLNFLKSVVTPSDSLALFFLATSPIYAIAGSTLIPLLAEARNSHQPLEHQLTNVSTQLLSDLKQARDQAPHQPTSAILLHWIETHNALQNLAGDQLDRGEGIAQTLTSFFSLIRRFERTTTEPNIFHFLEVLPILLSDGDEGSGEELASGHDLVRLFTIHMAKGLEFPIVYVTNLASERFPRVDRHRGFTIPPDLLHQPEPEGEFLREEHRLMYVAMTRAKHQLILTHAQVYDNGRPRQPSRFLSEIGDGSLLSTFLATSSDGFGMVAGKQAHGGSRGRGTKTPNVSDDDLSLRLPPDKPIANSDLKREPSPIHLTPHQIDDYLSCPLRYRYAHLDHLPVPDEQPLMIGQALHACFEFYLNERIHHKQPTQKQLLCILDEHWQSRGFLSAEHEAARRADAERQIVTFIKTFKPIPPPQSVEQPVTLDLETVMLHGRIDAVFTTPLPNWPEHSGPFVLDFKTSDHVTTQEQADRRAKDSLQLTLYALAWQKQHGLIPLVGLYFTASGLFGWSMRSERQLANSSEKS